jgi:hypothetical protein
MTSLFPPRESLVVTSRSWGWETREPFFYGVQSAECRNADRYIHSAIAVNSCISLIFSNDKLLKLDLHRTSHYSEQRANLS